MTAPAWLTERTQREPLILNRYLPITMHVLSDDTARLAWIFDDDDEDGYRGLSVHLTAEEAESVLNTTMTEGLLENVRPHLETDLAVLWHLPASGGPSALRARTVTVPRTGSEKELWVHLDAAGEEDFPSDPALAAAVLEHLTGPWSWG